MSVESSDLDSPLGARIVRRAKHAPRRRARDVRGSISRTDGWLSARARSLLFCCGFLTRRAGQPSFSPGYAASFDRCVRSRGHFYRLPPNRTVDEAPVAVTGKPVLSEPSRERPSIEFPASKFLPRGPDLSRASVRETSGERSRLDARKDIVGVSFVDR